MKLYVRIFPSAQAISTLQMDFNAPKSTLIQGLELKVDHHFVDKVLSIAFAGSNPFWVGLEMALVVGKLLLHEEEGGGEVIAAVVIAAVKVVEPASDEEGLNVAVFPSELSDTAPCTLVVPCFSVKDELVTVELCTGSLNVAVTDEVSPTPVAPSEGLVLTTVGGVVSADVESVVTVSF